MLIFRVKIESTFFRKRHGGGGQSGQSGQSGHLVIWSFGQNRFWTDRKRHYNNKNKFLLL